MERKLTAVKFFWIVFQIIIIAILMVLVFSLIKNYVTAATVNIKPKI